ncbi:MAG: DUF6077 domain-containing protein [Marmoricola sp.]
MTASVRDRDLVDATVDKPSLATRATSGVTRALDTVSDLAIAGFALWTVLYHLGLLLGIPTTPLLAFWVVGLAGILAVLVRTDEWRESIVTGVLGGMLHPGMLHRPAAVLATVLALASAACVTIDRTFLWWPAWALGAGAALLAAGAVLRHSRTAPRRDEAGDAWSRQPAPFGGTFLALGTALGLGIFSMFTARPDPDDTFYVNRAAWVAEHTTIPTRDTLFSDQVLRALSGAGQPIAAIETLQGAVAHELHVAAGVTAFLVTPAIATFLAVWATWRLIRAWAPRRHAACFVVAVIYLLWAAQRGGMLGVFFLARMQQGKVVFVSLLVPVLYLYLTRWAERGTRRNGLMLVAAGIAGVGFTSTATFVVPLICGAVGLPLLLTRRYRSMFGCLLPMIYPVIVGVVSHFTYGAVTGGTFHPSQDTFHASFGNSWIAAIGWLAALLAFWFAREGVPRQITVGVSLALVLVLAPGVLVLIKDTLGAQAVLWRTMWVAPLPTLVGLAASVQVAHRIRWAAPLVPLALVAVVLTAGTPLWAPQRNVPITDHPTWRYYPTAIRQARAIIKDYDQPGPVLAAPKTMEALAISTTRLHAVSPLLGYSEAIAEPAARHRSRLALAQLVGGLRAAPTPAALRADLDRLQVGLVCVPRGRVARRRLIEKAGFAQVRIKGAGQVCLQRPDGS